MAHLAHSWLTHGSLDSLGSHGSILAHSADLADLTDLAHSCLILGSLGSLGFTWVHLAHSWLSLGSFLDHPWLTCLTLGSHCSLGSLVSFGSHFAHSWLTLGSHGSLG